jgi:hypothetical protein
MGWMIKALEAHVGQFLLGCKCPVSRFLPGRAKDLSTPLYVDCSPMFRIEICPIEKCKISAGMLYQIFSDMTIHKKIVDV